MTVKNRDTERKNMVNILNIFDTPTLFVMAHLHNMRGAPVYCVNMGGGVKELENGEHTGGVPPSLDPL